MKKIIATAALLAATLTACGDDGDPPGTEPTTGSNTTSEPTESATEPTPTEPTSEPATDEDKAAAALEGYLEVRDNAYRTLQVSPKLNRYAQGTVHSDLQTLVQQFRDSDVRTKGDYVHDVGPVKQESTEAFIVTDCEDRSGVTQAVGDRPPVSMVDQTVDESGTPLPNPRRVRYRVVLVDGGWKVDSTFATRGEGFQSC